MSKLSPDIQSLTVRVKELEAQISMANHLTLRYESISRTCTDLMNERSQFASKLYAHGLGLHPNGTIYPVWMPEDDVVVRFDDKTGEQRDPESLKEMIDAMRIIANDYDFDLQQWGTGEGFLKYAEFQLDMRKKYGQI